MLKKITSLCFGVFVFSGLFFAAHSEGVAQWQLRREHSTYVEQYRSEYLALPRNMDEYDRYYSEEGKERNQYLGFLKENVLIRDEYFQGEKQKCQARRASMSKAECIKAMDFLIAENSGQYIEAVKEINKIYGERIRKLNEARSKFTFEQRQRTRQNRINMKKDRDREFLKNKRKYPKPCCK